MLRGQLEAFGKGFPFLRLSAAAAVGNGIMAPTEEQTGHYIDEWKRYKATRRKIEKFVPASGAASRMFKDLYAFLDAAYDVPTTDLAFLRCHRRFRIPRRAGGCLLAAYGIRH